MINFVECEMTCRNDGAEKKLKDKANELNTLYSKNGCSCHPDYRWRMAVDLTERCTFKVHDVSDKTTEEFQISVPAPCDFGYKFIRNVVSVHLEQ